MIVVLIIFFDQETRHLPDALGYARTRARSGRAQVAPPHHSRALGLPGGVDDLLGPERPGMRSRHRRYGHGRGRHEVLHVRRAVVGLRHRCQ